MAAARHLGSPRGRRQAEGLSQPLAAPAGSAAGMSQVPRKLPQEEGDEEEEEEEEIVGLAGYADGAESFSDGDAESGGDEACECCQPRPVRAWGGGAGLRGAGKSRAGSRAGGGVSGSGGGCRGLSEGCRAATGCAGGGETQTKRCGEGDGPLARVSLSGRDASRPCRGGVLPAIKGSGGPALAGSCRCQSSGLQAQPGARECWSAGMGAGDAGVPRGAAPLRRERRAGSEPVALVRSVGLGTLLRSGARRALGTSM